MLKIVKIIKTKWQERKLKKELNKHLIALDDAYDELISNRALSLWYHWTPEKYELLYDRIIKVIKGERGRKRTATPDRLCLGNATDYAKTQRSPHH